MPGTVYTPFVQVNINGGAASNVIGARVESSFADPVSRGYAKFSTAPSWGHGDEVTIVMGAGSNNSVRFTGSVYQGDYTNSGPTFELVCRGPLWHVQKFRNPYPNGLTLLDLTGGPATDEQITQAVLDVVGVSNVGSIGGTGIVRGGLAAVAYTWRKGESALEYLQRLSKASLGYRLIESIGGEIFRVQVLGRPRGSSDYSFTEGQDIFEGAHAQRSTFERYTAWSVLGFDYGDGNGAVNYSVPDDPGSTEVYTFQSDMIEKALAADPGDGISCEEVLEYIRAETDHEVVKVSGFQTPRDEVFGPGQTHNVNSALLGVTGEGLWVMGVSCEVDSEWFIQTMEYVGGGGGDGGGYEGP